MVERQESRKPQPFPSIEGSMRAKKEPPSNPEVHEEERSIPKPTFIPDPTLEEIHLAPNELGDVLPTNKPDPSLEEIIRRATERRQTPPEEHK